jgi:hypothetical protein
MNLHSAQEITGTKTFSAAPVITPSTVKIGGYNQTFPTATGTIMNLNTAQEITGTKTFTTAPKFTPLTLSIGGYNITFPAAHVTLASNEYASTTKAGMVKLSASSSSVQNNEEIITAYSHNRINRVYGHDLNNFTATGLTTFYSYSSGSNFPSEVVPMNLQVTTSNNSQGTVAQTTQVFTNRN